MSDPVSGIMGSAIQHQVGGASHQAQQHQTGTRSFESVLQNTGQQQAESAPNPLAQPTQVSGADLERMRLDLMQRVNSLPPGSPNVKALLPELLDGRTRLGLLREAMNGMKPSQTKLDLSGKLTQYESEFYEVDGIMKSNKDLSQGELLGLQARLYQVSQHVEVMSKVVDQVTNGIKTILNTNV